MTFAIIKSPEIRPAAKLNFNPKGNMMIGRFIRSVISILTPAKHAWERWETVTDEELMAVKHHGAWGGDPEYESRQLVRKVTQKRVCNGCGDVEYRTKQFELSDRVRSFEPNY